MQLAAATGLTRFFLLIGWMEQPITGQLVSEEVIARQVQGFSKQITSRNDLNTWRSEQNGQHFADKILNVISSMKLAVYFDINFAEVYSKGPIDSKLALVQVMAGHQTVNKPLLKQY